SLWGGSCESPSLLDVLTFRMQCHVLLSNHSGSSCVARLHQQIHQTSPRARCQAAAPCFAEVGTKPPNGLRAIPSHIQRNARQIIGAESRSGSTRTTTSRRIIGLFRYIWLATKARCVPEEYQVFWGTCTEHRLGTQLFDFAHGARKITGLGESLPMHRVRLC